MTTSAKYFRKISFRVWLESEWAKFARCGDGREFPWGDNWPPESGAAGNYGEAPWEKAFPPLKLLSGYDDGFAVSAPVDELWVNPWGLAGVGGNVWEVCAGDSAGASFESWRVVERVRPVHPPMLTPLRRFGPLLCRRFSFDVIALIVMLFTGYKRDIPR